MAQRIVVLALDGCLGSALLGLADLLSLARGGLARRGLPFDLDVALASPGGGPVTDGHGRRHAVDLDLRDVAACGSVLVPGFVPGAGGGAPDLGRAAAAAAWIRARHAEGAVVAASCSGVFLLGAAGLLDGRRCTTTWWLFDDLRARHPRADAAFGSTLVEDGRVITAGGPVSWVDIAFAVLRRQLGPEAARHAADFAVVDTSPSSQAAYVPVGHFVACDPFLIEAERAVRTAGADLTSAGLAGRLGLSERTLHRRLARSSGKSPRAFIESVRFDRVRTALDDRTRPVKQVAADAGFADEASFRRAFKRVFGITPSAYRRRARPD